MFTREDIVTEARKWIGVRWHHQGRSTAGVDCAGLIIEVAKAFDLPVPDNVNYHRRSHGKEFLKYLNDYMDKQDIAETIAGNVVALTEPMFPCHCGILSEKYGKIHLIHAYARRRKAVEELFNDAWKDKLLGVFSFPGVENG